MATKTVRLSVNLPEEVVKALREMADRQGITMTEALRKAIANERFLVEAADEGSKILIESKDKKELRQLVMR